MVVGRGCERLRRRSEARLGALRHLGRAWLQRLEAKNSQRVRKKEAWANCALDWRSGLAYRVQKAICVDQKRGAKKFQKK
jgi:hypothetical protein